MTFFSLSYLSLVPSISLWLTEVSDIHLGWQDACALEETGEFQAGAAKRYTSKCGDCPRAERRGEWEIGEGSQRHYTFKLK